MSYIHGMGAMGQRTMRVTMTVVVVLYREGGG